MAELTELHEGMPIVYGGDKITTVPADLASRFQRGDHLVVVQASGDLIHIPSGDWKVANEAVGRAHEAFGRMGSVTDSQISRFYLRFAELLADDEVFAEIEAANSTDVDRARRKGRSTTRLIITERMRSDMIAGLQGWAAHRSSRNEVVDITRHDGWSVEQVRAGLGVVGFVFEGRPNVFADATGVLRSGNTVVFRIGSDALGTARAIVEHALEPALRESGLPAGAASLVDSPSRSAGHAMFSDSRVALAVARGSGAAVTQLGSVARQAGISVSLHGTGGAWIVAGASADPERFGRVVTNSLDRKVCNTLNTCCIVRERLEDLLPIFLDALDSAGRKRESTAKLHVVADQSALIPGEWFDDAVIVRADGDVVEQRTGTVEWHDLGHEWEWEDSPEVTLAIVESVEEAIVLFNDLSPRFAASLVSEDSDEQARFFDTIDAPFVGDGMTRWVDGQYAFGRPELGLSNWEFGRLFGRGGVLSGDSVFTVRARATQSDPDLRR